MTIIRPKPVIVVGSGLAGLTAAYTALQSGARVCLLDRSPRAGGNSIKASSGINGAYTRFQKAAGIPGDDQFLADTRRSAGGRLGDGKVDREGLMRVLTEESKGTVEWLVDEIGVDLSVVAALGGHSVARTHRGAGQTPPGAALITAFLGKLKKNEHFTMYPASEVLKLVQDRDVPGAPVTGVEFVRTNTGGVAWTERISGSVVFATGGFAGDANGLLARYRPDLTNFPATAETRPGAHGILVDVGAVLVDMDAVQIHPTGFVQPGEEAKAQKFLAAEMLRGVGGILVDSGGRRFVNEMADRKTVSERIMGLEKVTRSDTQMWDVRLFLDPGASVAAESHLSFYRWKGLLRKMRVGELPGDVQETIREYARIVKGEKEDPYGRTHFGNWSLDPADPAFEDAVIHIGQVTPVVHFTMGGVAFDTQAHVLRKDESTGELVPIPGLFAAGEITGGLHGDNRLGGSSLLECAVYGRIAGKAAADWIIRQT